MIADCMNKFRSFGVGLDHGRSKTIDLDTLIFLSRCFFGSELGDGPWYHVPEGFAFQHFILTFSDLYHPLAEPSLCEVFPHSIVVLQYHLSYFAHVGLEETLTTSPESEGLLLKRQVAKIGRLTHAKNFDDDHASRNRELADQYFRERVLSVSLTMCSGDGGVFKLIVLGDKGAQLDATQQDAFCSWENKLRMGPGGLGTLDGLSHFLIALTRLVETWHRGWSATLDAIDEIVGFTVS